MSTRRHRAARARCLEGATHCTWCGCPISDELPAHHPQKATADHVEPQAHGGVDHEDNYVPACFACNSKRQDRDPSVLRHDVAGAEDW